MAIPNGNKRKINSLERGDNSKLAKVEKREPRESPIPCGNKAPDCNDGDCYGGSIITTWDGNINHHVFKGLTKKGILFKGLQIRDSDILLCINDEDTAKLPHEQVLKRFENIETKKNTSIVIYRTKEREFIRISFPLHGCKNLLQGGPAWTKFEMKIRCQENPCYLTAEPLKNPNTLVFKRITDINKQHYHFTAENVRSRKYSLRLKTAHVDSYVGFKKGTAFDQAFLVDGGDKDYITEYDILFNQQNACFEISFFTRSRNYYLQMDNKTLRLVAKDNHSPRTHLDVFFAPHNQ